MLNIKKHFDKKSMRFVIFGITAVFMFANASLGSFSGGNGFLLDTATDFYLPFFNDGTGLKEIEFTGAKVTNITDENNANEQLYDIDGVHVKVFDKADADNLIDIKSSNATLRASARTITSSKEVVIKRKDFEVSGVKWNANLKKESSEKESYEIKSNVKINLFSQIFSGMDNPLLKDIAKKSDSDKTTTIFGDAATLLRGEFDDVFTIKKNVKVSNSGGKLDCDNLEVVLPKSGKKNVKALVADGNVKMSFEDYSGSAQRAEVDPANSIATLLNSARMQSSSKKVSVSGEKIVLNYKDKKIELPAINQVKTRPQSDIIHALENDKEQNISIIADSIKMLQSSSGKRIDFVGNVKIKTVDYEGYCDILTAKLRDSKDVGASDSDAIETIEGSGNVRFEGIKGEMFAKSFVVNVKDSELELYKDVKILDPKNGFEMESAILILNYKNKSGSALADKNLKDSTVKVAMQQKKQADISTNIQDLKKINVDSKTFTFGMENDGNVKLIFTQDVKVDSGGINVTCQRIEILGAEKSGSTDVYKIEATDNVKVVKEDYVATAELAEIYPHAKDENLPKSGKMNKTVILKILKEKSNIRPTITLPAFGNLGLNDKFFTKNSKSQPTVIISDEQSLAEVGSQRYCFFKGNVEVTGTNMNATCGKAAVTLSPTSNKKDGSDISHIQMEKKVNITQGLKMVSCDILNAYPKEEKAILKGNISAWDKESGSPLLPSLDTEYLVEFKNGEFKLTKPESTPQNADPYSDEQDNRPTIMIPNYDKIKK